MDRGRCADRRQPRELQQLTEGRCAGLMQSGTEGHLHRFQIQLASLLALREDAAQQRGYFARDLSLDRLGRFSFLWRQCVLNRTRLTNLLIDLKQSLARLCARRPEWQRSLSRSCRSPCG